MLDVHHKFPPKTKVLLKPKRYKILFGGRGSGKSHSVARMLVILASTKPMRILCTRELQMSIRESVHKLLSTIIDDIGMHDFYRVEQSGIYGVNGSQFIFEGLKNNTTKIKSMENISICWCEESEAISENSWDLLIPTIRAQGSEIWIVFNPADEMDDTYQRFVSPYLTELEANDGIFENEDVTVVQMNHEDNPWFPEELQKEMERCKVQDYKKYLHIWEGQCIADYDDSIIDPLWVRAAIDAHVKLGFKGKGVKSMGYDPADGGKDSKAICIRHGSVVTHAKQWFTGDITQGTDKAFELAAELGVTDIVYDQIGVGTGVKDYVNRLQGRGQFTVTGFNASASPEQPDKKYMGDRPNDEVFRNRRAQAFWHLRDRFFNTYRAVEHGDYSDPDTLISLDSGIDDLKVLISELSRIQRKRNNNTQIQIESKDDMKRRGMPSPGLADSLMYAFANPPININHAADDWSVAVNM